MVTLILILTGLLYTIKILEALSIPLFITFLILKLTSVIAWSWWLVCLPVILIPAMFILQGLVIGLMHVCAENI